MPNGVRRNNNTRHSNRHRQQQQPPVIIAEVFDSRVIIQGEEVNDDEVTELRREIQRLKQFIKKEEKDNTKIMKQSKITLEEVFERLKKEVDLRDKLADKMVQYEGVIQYFEDEGFITFKNQTKGMRLSHERTLKNLSFHYIHNEKGDEIKFKQLPEYINSLREQTKSALHKSKFLKELTEKLLNEKKSNPHEFVKNFTNDLINDENNEQDKVFNVEDDMVKSPINKDTVKGWRWRGEDYIICGKKIFNMDDKEVGETIGKIPHLWDKWWEELD